MERRYLVAALAIIATFASFSRGFQSLQKLSLQRGQHGQVMRGPQCSALPSLVSSWVARIKSELHPTDPEEAQVLAELNLPVAAIQAKAAAEAARQSVAAAEISRQTAMREAESARREAMRMHERMARANDLVVTPVTLDLQGLDGLDRRIQAQVAAAERTALRNVRVQVNMAKLQLVSTQSSNSAKHRSPCAASSGEIQ